jgi:hypothetical protein
MQSPQYTSGHPGIFRLGTLGKPLHPGLPF